MMVRPFQSSLAFALLLSYGSAQDIVNGQIYTPGIALVDAPQPNTPLGGDHLHVALDVTSNGQLQLPPYPEDAVSALHNITIFLSSYATGRNFTISNGTASAGNASLGEIMQQEPGSTVKHVNWMWPDCLVGDGNPEDSNSARGLYNISIRQNFRMNGTSMYTIFDLPIRVTNSIPAAPNRPPCDTLDNPMLDEATLNASASWFTRVAGTSIETEGTGSGIGGLKPQAQPQDGLGGAGALNWGTGLHSLWMAVFVFMFAY